jgi:hypothetical protein
MIRARETQSAASWFTQTVGSSSHMVKYAGLQVGLDGSWTKTAGSYAGVVGTQEAWNYMGGKWEDLLEEYGIESLRTTEAMNFKGQFRNKYTEWEAKGDPRKIRDECLLRFARLKKQCELHAVGCSVAVRGLGDRTLTQKKQELFQRVVHELIQSGDQKSKFIIISDQEEDLEDRARKWIARLKLQDSAFARIVGLCFVDDKYVNNVQLADMVAYVLRDDLERSIYRPNDPPTELYNLLIGSSPVVDGLMVDGRVL